MNIFNKINFAIILFVILFFMGCDNSSGDSSQNNSNDNDIENKVIATENDLPICNADNEGQLFYILDIKQFEYCDGTGYQIIEETGGQIKVYDGNNSFLGYSLNPVGMNNSSLSLISPTGYAYKIYVSTDSPYLSIDNATSIYYHSTNCSGSSYTMVSRDTIGGFPLVFFGDKTYIVTSSEIETLYLQSTTTADHACLHADTQPKFTPVTEDVYEVESISRSETGIPESMVPPLHYVLE